MNWAYAAFVTMGLIAIPVVIVRLLAQMGVDPGTLRILEFVIGFAVIIGSAYFVLVDSEKIEYYKYEGGRFAIEAPPQALAVVCIILWLVFMPIYLQKRWLIKNYRAKLKPEFHPNYKKPQ